MRSSLLACIVLLINLMAIGQEKVIYDEHVEKRTVGSFQTLRVSDGIDVYITQSDDEGVAVSANEVAHRDKVKTVVENGELRIFIDGSGVMAWNWKNRKLRAYVAVKSLTKVRASGGSDVIIRGGFKSDKLHFALSGGSDLSGEVAVTDLTIDQSGGSDTRLKGTVVNLRLEASGGSDFNGYELIAEYAILKASGGSDASVTVTKEMAAEASGGSDVNYKGSPEIKYRSTSGGGSVTNRGGVVDKRRAK